jgi:hypothetical protein
MTLLIIGVDPGTTLGYAIISEKGEFITNGSGKEFGISELITNIISFGKPLIVACDKNPPPAFAESLAVKLGAKLFFPREDLLVNEKRELVEEYDAKLNIHELDALASAVLALKRHKRFFEKINYFLEKHNRKELEEEVKLIMARNEELPLEAALRMAEEKHRVIEKKAVQPRAINAPEKRISEKQVEELRLKLVLLEEKNRKLKHYLNEKEKLVGKLKKRLSQTPGEQLVGYKESRIKHYTKQLKDNVRLVRHYEKELRRRDEFIASISLGKGVLVKKLDDLSQDEFANKNFLNIKEGDVLLIRNPASMSPRVIEELKGKVKIIITESILRNPLPGFVFLKPEGIIILESAHFAIADKKALEEALKKKDILKSIVDEYKKERKSE